MADSAGQHSFNTQVFFAAFATANPIGADPAGAGFTALGEVISMNGVGMQSSVTELTHLTSDDRAKEKIPGLMDGGQLNLKVNYTEAGMGVLTGTLMPLATAESTVWERLAWVVQFPSGGQWFFKGFLANLPFDVPEDNRITVDMTVEISGRPEFTAQV